MISVFVRAIVTHDDQYLLMQDFDINGKELWELPGGELFAGLDMCTALKKLVLQNTGYVITDLKFFDIACNIRKRASGIEAETTLDFIFSAGGVPNEGTPALKYTELLPYANFAWLNSDGRFRDNKVMATLDRYHKKRTTATKATS